MVIRVKTAGMEPKALRDHPDRREQPETTDRRADPGNRRLRNQVSPEILDQQVLTAPLAPREKMALAEKTATRANRVPKDHQVRRAALVMMAAPAKKVRPAPMDRKVNQAFVPNTAAWTAASLSTAPGDKPTILDQRLVSRNKNSTRMTRNKKFTNGADNPKKNIICVKGVQKIKTCFVVLCLA